VAVVLSHDDYESLIETLNVLSDEQAVAAIGEAEADLRAGRVTRTRGVSVGLERTPAEQVDPCHRDPFGDALRPGDRGRGRSSARGSTTGPAPRPQ
jgi:hypothetical protein